MAAFRYIDLQDIPKALKIIGANKVTIDRNDSQKSIRDLEIQLSLTQHRMVSDHDLSRLIVGMQGTESSDVTVPAGGTLAPLDNATGVAVNIQPNWTFPEQIVFGAEGGSFSLFRTTGALLIQQFTIPNGVGPNPGQMEITGGNKVTLHPPAPLTAATAYYILWTAGVVRDLAGNPVAANAVNTVWNFTTA